MSVPDDVAWPTNGARAILGRAVADIEKLDKEKADIEDVKDVKDSLVLKADTKDVAALAKSVDKLTRTFQWFMGIVATGVFVFAGVVLQQLASHHP